jgi:NADPH:quinone reductase-like Zn-dependent oxidoreductase
MKAMVIRECGPPEVVIGSVGRITAEDLTLTLAWAAEGRYRVRVDRVLPLAEAAHAHRIVEDRSGIGKVLLQP